jgi:hypothetical protein
MILYEYYIFLDDQYIVKSLRLQNCSFYEKKLGARSFEKERYNESANFIEDLSAGQSIQAGS